MCSPCFLFLTSSFGYFLFFFTLKVCIYLVFLFDLPGPHLPDVFQLCLISPRVCIYIVLSFLFS